MIGIFIALLSGALMSIQGVFNTEVTERTSIWVAGAFVQLTALIVCLAAWGITDRSSYGIEKRRTEIYALRRSHRSLHHDHRY